MPENKKVESNELISVESQVIQISGPLPLSLEFERYERVLPGCAERILAIAEKEGEARREENRRLITEMIRANKVGQGFAFTIALCYLISGACIYGTWCLGARK
jgi:uncharacterized membrane protein